MYTNNPKPSPGSSYSVVAWVTEPKPEQTVKLNLPPGMSFEGCQQEQPVSRSEKGLGQVSWKVHVAKETEPGEYLLRAETKGAEAKLGVMVFGRSGSSGFDLD